MQWNTLNAMALALFGGLFGYALAALSLRLRIAGAERALSEARISASRAEVELQTRQAEWRQQIADARSRESDAQVRSASLEGDVRRLTDALQIAVEERGRLHSEATRVDEMRTSLASREHELQILQQRVTELETEKATAIAEAHAATSRAEALIENEKISHAAIIRAKDEQIAKLNEFIGQAREALTNEFKALSADTLKDASDRLTRATDAIIEKHAERASTEGALNKQQIETMLKPVEETIKRLDKHVEDSNVARSNAEAVLDEQVKRLAGASESLTNALRRPVARGSWGEMTLENALENAGLEPQIDYILQHTTDDDDGRKRTDAVINLPKGRKLVIDSKNLMETYMAFLNASDDAQRAILADHHAKSLRVHIRSLSGKEYWRRYEGLDCVILFIPHDGMYHAAIQDQSELIREACDRRVFVANPMSLIPLLKAIRYVLDQERLNKSAVEISRVGAELYGEVTRFADSFAKIGARLRSTVNAYNDAIPGLDRFIVAKSRTLRQLGAGKGMEAELPDSIEIEPKLFSSRELRTANSLLDPTDALGISLS